jgi:uncharacterized protein (TIGR03435 family)
MRRAISVATFLLCAVMALPQTASAPSFDVASIRPSTMTYGSYIRYLPGGRLSGMSWIKQVIQVAYGVADYQVTGGPGWLTTDRYTIEAKAGNPDATKDEINLMLQSLLVERFKLRVHRETKDFSTYDLVVDKNGPKLTPLKQGEDFGCTRDNTEICGLTSPADVAGWLRNVVGKPVFDRTGITGRFKVLLTFDVYSERGRTPPEGYDKPSLKDALHDQLGLKLVPHTQSMPVLVVDSIERPTEN